MTRTLVTLRNATVWGTVTYHRSVLLRVGFLGAGFIANLHAYQIQRCETPNVISSVFDPDTDRAAGFADLTGARAYRSPGDVIESSDVVFVCNWTSEHPDSVELAAKLGKAIFVEKPLAKDLASAKAVARIVDECGVPNAVGLVLRSSPAFLAVRHLINGPQVGRVMNVALRDDQYIPVQGIYNSDWRVDSARSGSGVLLEHSIHDLDILEWLFGTITSISALSSNFHGYDGVEDSVSLTARFASGATATLSTVWHDVLSRPSERMMEVFAENTYVGMRGDLFGPVAWTQQSTVASGSSPGTEMTGGGSGEVDGSSIVDWLVGNGVEVISAEERFLRAVASGSRDTGPTVAEALRAHVLIDVASRSADLGGQAVDVPA